MDACGISWQSAGASDTGLVREHNEDSLLDRPDLGLWVVADGMGGHSSGDFASQTLCSELSKLPGHLTLADAVDFVDDTCLLINEQLVNLANQRGGGTVIGTTVVALVARQSTAICLWAGDSRLYRLRGGTIEQISQDHSYLSQPEQEEHPEIAATHGHIITRAVGAATDLHLDLEAVQLAEGDRYLLCSDGLTNELNLENLQQTLAQGSAEECCQRLVQQAVTAGGRDNATALVADFGQLRREQATE